MGRMNFDFSDDQKFLKDEARKFLDAHCTTATVRSVLDDDAAVLRRGAVEGRRRAGLAGRGDPGGTTAASAWATWSSACIAEELGRARGADPVRLDGLFLRRGADAGRAATRRRRTCCRKIAAGELIGCLATVRRARRADGRPSLQATRRGRQADRRQAAGDRRRRAPTSPWCWPRRAAGRACSWST